MPHRLEPFIVALYHRFSSRVSRAVGALVVIVCLLCPGLVSAGEAESGETNLLTLSEPYRVSLHHDPSLSAPLTRLWDIYAARNSSAELLQLYRGHVQSYPQDAKAWAVLVRLLDHAGEAADAAEALATALRANPGDAYLRSLHADTLASDGLTREAAAAYIQAAGDAQQAGKRRLWLRSGLLLAAHADDQELLAQGLHSWQADPQRAADATLDVARELLRAGQSGHAQQLVTDVGELQGETLVDATLLRAEIASQRGESADATALLDQLLDRLDSSYWRRQEIFGQRLRLVGDDAAVQDELLERLRAQTREQPQSASAWLDLHRALGAFAQGEEALAALQQAAEHLPADPDIERALVRSYRREGRLPAFADWLEERLQAEPERQDLRARLVLTRHILEQPEAAERAFAVLLQGLPAASHHQQRIALARQLAPLGLNQAATALILRVLDDQPERLDLLSEAVSWTHEHAPLQVADLLSPQRLRQSDAEVALAIELARNLISINQRAAAWQVLLAVVETYPHNSDLRALLAETAWYLGRQHAVDEHRQQLLTQSQTPAAYRRYLGVLMATTAEERRNQRLWEELRSLPADQSARQEAVVERLLNQKDNAADLLRWIDAQREADQETAAQWHPILVRVLRLLPEQGQRLQQALRQLADERPEEREKLLAEQFLHAQAGQVDHSDMPLTSLNDIDIGAIRDVDLLQQLLTTLGEDGDPVLRERLYRQLLSVSADTEESLNIWQAWLSLLLERGEEPRFRAEARRLLAANQHLDARSKARVHRQMEASIWRQVASSLAVEDSSGLLDLAAQAERIADRQLPWVRWLQAVLAQRRGDVAARDAALLALHGGDQQDGTPAKETLITFPDGVRIQAQALPRLAQPPSPIATGPAFALPPYQLAWRSRTLTHATALVPYDQGVVVRDPEGLVAFAHDSGRVLWRQAMPVPSLVTPQLLRYDDLLLLNTDAGIEARDFSGSLRWRAAVCRFPQFTVGDGLVVALDSTSGDLIAVEAASGRRLWLAGMNEREASEATLPHTRGHAGGYYVMNQAQAIPQQMSVSPGSLALADGLVLSTINGLHLYDAQHGGLVWRLGEHGEPDLPLELSTGKRRRQTGDMPAITSGRGMHAVHFPVHMQTYNQSGMWSGHRWYSQRLNHGHHGHRGGPRDMRVHMVDDVSAWYDSNIGGNGFLIGPWALLEGSNMVLVVRRDLPFIGRHFLPGRVLTGGSTPLLISRSGITRLYADGSRREYQQDIIEAAVSGSQILLINQESAQVLHEESLTPIAQAPLPPVLQELLREAADPQQRSQAQQQLQGMRRQLQRVEQEARQYAQQTGGSVHPHFQQQLQHLQFEIARLTRLAAPVQISVSPCAGRWYVQVGTALLAIDGISADGDHSNGAAP